MNNLEIKSRLDGEGKLKLPRKFSEAVNISPEDYFQIEFVKDQVTLQRMPECYFCGQPEEEYIFKGRQICSSCRDELVELI